MVPYLTGVVMMTIRVGSNQEAVRIEQKNRELEQSLLLTPLPSMVDDMIRQQVFSDPRLQMTNWAWERAKQLEAEEERKKQQQRIAYRQQHPVNQADDGLEL